MKKQDNSFSKQISNFYDNIAKSRKKWIKKSSAFHKEDSLNFNEFILPQNKVLELGCGTGNLLKSVNPSYAVGVDISKEIIKEAKKEHKKIKFFTVIFLNYHLF